MSRRSATYTIKGYLYQFNVTILEILNAENNKIITVEGIEDIDVFSSDQSVAIQCKYHEKTKYSHSAIKEAIQLMLRDYKNNLDNNVTQMRYKYYGHFKSGQENLDLPLDIDFLKRNLLSGKKGGSPYQLHKDIGLSDIELQGFIGVLDIDINAPSYEELESQTFEAFKNERGLECRSLDEAKGFFYSNALNVVADLARQHSIDDRKITKVDFIKRINTKRDYFDKWFLIYKSKKEYIAYIRSKYFRCFNRSPYERFFLVDTINSSFQDIKQLVLIFSEKYTKNSRRDSKPYCPYIYLHNFSSSELKKLKIQLQNEGVNFIDGFDFENADFSAESLIKNVDHHNKISLKFINRIEFIDDVIEVNKMKTKEIYQFYFDERIYQKENDDVRQVSILIQSMKDIKEMI